MKIKPNIFSRHAKALALILAICDVCLAMGGNHLPTFVGRQQPTPTVRVLNANQIPCANAKVEVFRRFFGTRPFSTGSGSNVILQMKPVAVLASDRNGMVKLHGLGAGAWRLRASVKGQSASSEGWIPDEFQFSCGSKSYFQELKMRKSRTFTIKVIDPDGLPVSGAFVVAQNPDAYRQSLSWCPLPDEKKTYGTTNQHGLIIFEAFRGEDSDLISARRLRLLLPRVGGAFVDQIFSTTKPGQVILVHMPKTVTLKIKIETGDKEHSSAGGILTFRPIAGRKIKTSQRSIRSWRQESNLGDLHFWIPKQGATITAFAPNSQVCCQLSSANHETAPKTTTLTLTDSKVQKANLQARAWGLLKFNITNQEGEAFDPDLLWVEFVSDKVLMIDLKHTLNETTAHVHLRPANTGSVVVYDRLAFAGNRPDSILKVIPISPLKLNEIRNLGAIVVDTPKTIASGTVVDRSGQSVPGVSIRIVATPESSRHYHDQERHCQTDAEGKFEIKGWHHPNVFFGLHVAEESNSAPRRFPSGTKDMRVVVSRPGSFSGSLSLPAPELIKYGEYTLTSRFSGHRIHLRPNAKGEFLITGLPTGRYTLDLRFDGEQILIDDDVAIEENKTTSHPALKTAIIGKGFELRTIMVVGSKGKKVAGALVQVHYSRIDRFNPRSWGRHVYTDSQGRATVLVKPSPRLRLVIRGPSTREGPQGPGTTFLVTKTITVQNPRFPLVITLKP